MLGLLPYCTGTLCGGFIGFSLALLGGGGSILAVPLMVYLLGVQNPHVAIGTSALAVAANASAGLVSHARARTVKWRCGAIYAAAGASGALLGSSIGKAIDGGKLLFLFALVMLLVAALMLKKWRSPSVSERPSTIGHTPKILGFGFGTGLLSGFFGIGGGLLIVPGLLASTNMPIINAVGTSLIAVAAFGLTTAVNYALSSYVDWPLAAVFVVGGGIGVIGGTRLAQRLSKANKLTPVFAAVICIVAIFMLGKTLHTL
jgi:uncharacterized membrane protein YfcA